MRGERKTSVVQLTDDARLIEQVGELRWSEWGHGEISLEEWTQISARECGQIDLPITLAALDDAGVVQGAVGLGEIDDALTADERRGRGPWLLGLVVRSDRRDEGVGRDLVRALETAVGERGFSEVWVSTGEAAVAFYERCGWTVQEHIVLAKGGWTNHLLVRSVG